MVQQPVCSLKKCVAAFHPVCVLRELVGPPPWSVSFDESHPGAFLRKPVQPLVLRDEVRRVIAQHWGEAG